MSAGGHKRKSRSSVLAETVADDTCENSESSEANSDLEPGEIVQESDVDMMDGATTEIDRMNEFIENGKPSMVEMCSSEINEDIMSDGVSISPRRKDSKKCGRVEEKRRHGKSDRSRNPIDREDSRRRRHRSGVVSSRERFRRKEEVSPRVRRCGESSRRREEKHHRRIKKHRRRHREKDRQEEHPEEDLMVESEVDEAEKIEREREERKKRMEAIKNKYRTMEVKEPQGKETVDSDGGSGKSTNEVQAQVVGDRSTSPDSVSSADLALFRGEEAKVVNQVSSVFSTDNSQLIATSEVDIDKNVTVMEKDACSTDHLKMLKDEKHDKEKLLVDQQHGEHEKQNTVLETDDIFCDTPEDGNKDYSALDNAVKRAAANRGLIDAYDDSEGYYKFRIGEILDNRYEISSCNGKGVFSTVLRGKDKVRKNPDGDYPDVCIKMIRANDLMRNCGRKEEQFLKKLSASDPENKRHCIRLLRSFVYRGHLCLVFEPMAMNLRELTKKFGRDVGLSLDGVGHFTAQLLVALKHLKINKILHADIKPDNILVNEKFSRVKLCDFGSAMEDWSTEITPYVCSRFYRPPEVILGLEYSYGMDMWSLGCVIYEMFTGQYLFPGRTNNTMLKLMMDVKGGFPKKLLKKASFCEEHFEKDVNMSFIETDIDKFTKRPVKQLIPNPTVKHNFQSLLSKFSAGCDHRLVAQLADLLEKMMMLDPDKRIDVDEAMRHPFVKTYLHKAKNAQHHKEQQEQAAQQKATLKQS